MFARRQPVIEAMDRVAELFCRPLLLLLGIASVAEVIQPARPRSYRYLPAVLLLMAVAGLIWIIAGWRMAGAVILNMVFAISVFIRTRSPLAEGPRRHDERETALFRLGHFWGLFAVALIAIGGCFYLGASATLSDRDPVSLGEMLTGHRLWLPRSLEWFEFALFLIVVEANIAVLVTSWSVPATEPDED